MALYLTYSMYYFIHASIRHFLICLLTPFVKRPQRLMDVSNFIYIAEDVLVVVALTVFGSQAIFDDKTMECRETSQAMLYFWVICVCVLVFGWVYSSLLCFGLASIPLILVFWCFY